MTQRYIDLAFDDTSPRSFGGFDNENEATVIRLKVLNPDAKYYIEIEQACGKHDKYCSDVLPVDDGYAVFEVPRDFTHETLYVQGVMKVDGMCRKTARVRVGFSHSINALDELPESHPSWADSIDERIDGLEIGMKDAVTYTPQTLTDAQKQQARQNIGAVDENLGCNKYNIHVTTTSGTTKDFTYYTNEGEIRQPTEAVDSSIRTAFLGLTLWPSAKGISENLAKTLSKQYKILYDANYIDSPCCIIKSPLESGDKVLLSYHSSDNTVHVSGGWTDGYYNIIYDVANDVLTYFYVDNNISAVNGAVNQLVMSANPTEDMHIATKQYVDTAKTEAQQLGLTTATPGKTIKVKTVQDGKPTEWEVADIYEKSDTGIPKSDLAQSVQTSLDKADTAISYDSQTLTEAQQKQARTNIGAGQPLFVVNVTTTLSEQGDEVYTADKTAAEIETAYQEGCEIVCRMSVPIIGMGLVPVQLPLASRRGRQIFMFAINQTMWTDKSSRIVSYLVTIADDGVNVGQNNTEIYIKPASGIPKTDLADDVQTSLVREVPSVTASDNGKFLRVVSGAWTAVEIENANGGSF